MFKDHFRDVRDYIDYLFVSIDGVGEIHDKMRGVEGSFERAKQGIAVASEEIPVSLSSTITSENTDQVDKIVDFANELNVTVSFQVAYDYWTAEKMSPSSAKLKNALIKLLDLKKSGAPIVETKEYFGSFINSWYNGISWKFKPWLTINIDPEGRVVLPCYALNEYTGSKRIWEIDLPDVWNSVN